MADAKIVLASHNKGKLKELREILRGRIDGLDVDTQVVDASSVNAPDVPETGVTFAENSLLKARAVAEQPAWSLLLTIPACRWMCSTALPAFSRRAGRVATVMIPRT